MRFLSLSWNFWSVYLTYFSGIFFFSGIDKSSVVAFDVFEKIRHRHGQKNIRLNAAIFGNYYKNLYNTDERLFSKYKEVRNSKSFPSLSYIQSNLKAETPKKETPKKQDPKGRAVGFLDLIDETTVMTKAELNVTNLLQNFLLILLSGCEIVGNCLSQISFKFSCSRCSYSTWQRWKVNFKKFDHL